MTIVAGLNRRYVVIGGALLFTIWLWVAFERPTSFPTSLPFISGLADPKKDAFDYDTLNSEPIKELCSKTEWNPNLIFTCDNNHGGVGHVRNSILNCVRYAMQAGASLVMPNIALRDIEVHMLQNSGGQSNSHSHINRRHGPGRKGLEFMFDKQHFKKSLRRSCPQMKIVDEMDPFISENRRGLAPESLFVNRPVSGPEHPEEWRSLFESWLDKNLPSALSNERLIIDLEQSLLVYPIHADGHPVAHVFGDMLKFRSDVRRLATSTLRRMSQWYDLDMDISEPIIKHSYFGAHLRTNEANFVEKRHTVDNPFESLEGQAEAYLKQASASKFTIMYVASGNDTAIHKMALAAEPYKIAITHKADLLKGAERDELEKLHWDQRAIVDYLVLLKSTEFAGIGHSMLSWNVALKRQEYAHQMGSYEEPKQMWTDKQSTLYGTRRGYVESSVCMWP
ncbi:hypothetical protein BP6252_01920 [Coleophoma cylindrospora]|uniref:Alternative oxidase n=1 Tax=Coleophoma cylindrospora TaxID=1849047 RepID=A0A3D8SDB8_9HELO|nr:hypothetical protein BP6252_01920 [Coleophoma cylindrospora]